MLFIQKSIYSCFAVSTGILSFQIDFFEDVGVKALVYLDNLYQIDNLQKSQFYKGLPQIIQNLPHRICIDRYVTFTYYVLIVTKILQYIKVTKNECSKNTSKIGIPKLWETYYFPP